MWTVYERLILLMPSAPVPCHAMQIAASGISMSFAPYMQIPGPRQNAREREKREEIEEEGGRSLFFLSRRKERRAERAFAGVHRTSSNHHHPINATPCKAFHYPRSSPSSRVGTWSRCGRCGNNVLLKHVLGPPPRRVSTLQLVLEEILPSGSIGSPKLCGKQFLHHGVEFFAGAADREARCGIGGATSDAEAWVLVTAVDWSVVEDVLRRDGDAVGECAWVGVSR